MAKAQWAKYANDFNALTDAEIQRASDESQRVLDEAEEWLEAVAAWEADGKPRKGI